VIHHPSSTGEKNINTVVAIANPGFCKLFGSAYVRIGNHRKASWEMQAVQLARHRARLSTPSQYRADGSSVGDSDQWEDQRSESGCMPLNTLKPFAPGTKIRRKMTHGSVNFQALGKVV
jgi:hypothetical protein